MIKKLQKVFSHIISSTKIQKPRDPTISQSFETKISEQQMKILLDPRGFMNEEEKIIAQSNILKKVEQQEQINQNKTMEPEYGCKPKGPEPTRYGDWEIKGKCVDF